VAADSFYIGNLKGVGKVDQLTAVGTATRWAMVWIVHGTVNKATKFDDALAAKNVTRVFIPARSPKPNAVVELIQGTMLQGCWRPAFHRLCFMNGWRPADPLERRS
jgi:hypothetical protein